MQSSTLSAPRLNELRSGKKASLQTKGTRTDRRDCDLCDDRLAMSQWWEPLGKAHGEIEDARYRLMLWRTTPASGPAPLVFLMLNPGRGHPLRDGRTIDKCLAVAEHQRFGGIVVVNLCAYRTTKPERLLRAHARGIDIFHAAENDGVILRAAELGPVVCAWGTWAATHPLPRRVSHVLPLLRGRGATLLSFELTRGCYPPHPLSLDVQPESRLRPF